MQNPTGRFIVIEGADGSGKTTQFKLITERLKAVGYDVEVFKFPQYDAESSYFVKKYLNGDYGPAKNINPYTATLFYALDRYDAAQAIRDALVAGKIVVSDRYVGSNMAHQGGKFQDQVEKRGFFVWEDSLEFQLLGLPRPNINLFLKVPVEISVELASRDKARSNRSYTTQTTDEHEGDIQHLKNSVDTYDLLCEIFPNDFTAIDCVKEGRMMSIPEINDIIWETLQPVLPPRPKVPGKGVTVDLSSESIEPKPTKIVLSDKLDIKLRTSYLIATELSDWLRIRDISPTWQNFGYHYYTPDRLSGKTLEKYRSILDQIVLKHKKIDKILKDRNASKAVSLPCTPLAALVDINLRLSLKEAKELVTKLASVDLPEARLVIEQVESEALAKWHKNYKPLELKPNSPEQINKIIERLVHESFSQNIPGQPVNIELVDYTPKNEFKSLGEVIYPHSEFTRSDLEFEIDKLPYQKKVNLLTSALGSELSSLANQLIYTFDITADRLALLDLKPSNSYHDLKIQAPTPRFGYEVPEIVDKLGITDDYLDIFDLSLEAYSTLQASSAPLLAQYAVMLGHKSRFQLKCSLRYINGLRHVKTTDTMSLVVNQLIESVAQVHPVSANYLQSTTKPPVSSKSGKPKHKK